jgi:SHS2 domain-containing protein
MPFKFLEKIAIADIAFEVTAPTLNKLFEDAAMAASDIIVNPATIKQRTKKEITLKADTLEHLLYDFLSEIIFIKDTDGLLFSKFSAEVVHDDAGCLLTAICYGEVIDRKRHDLRNDLKAITMHMFLIEKRRSGWYARVVVDI